MNLTYGFIQQVKCMFVESLLYGKQFSELGLHSGWDRQDPCSHGGYIPEGEIDKKEVHAPDKFRPEIFQGNKADGKMERDVGGERTTRWSGSRRHSLTKARLGAANPTDSRVSISFLLSLVAPFLQTWMTPKCISYKGSQLLYLQNF